MFLMVKVTEQEVYVMDLDDFSVVSMPKSIFIQSKCFGIPCETRYTDLLCNFDLRQLSAGFYNYGVENVLKELCEIEGKSYEGLSCESAEMPLGSLSRIATGYEIEIRDELLASDIPHNSDNFDAIMDSLRNFTESELDYGSEEFSADIFGGDTETAEGVEQSEDSEFDYEDDEDLYDYSDDDEEGNFGTSDTEQSDNMFNIAKLYGMLSQSQVALLNKYYKWHSKRVFLSENGSLHLDTVSSREYNEWKKRELANIRGDEEWTYEGCVDTGEFPGGYCEMGHPLRYIHYAKGAESGRVVCFGNKCVGDFFEVDATVMKAIRKAQSEATSDLVDLCGIYSDSERLEIARESFEVLNFVLEKLREKGGKLSSITKFALEFKDEGLVYPKTLVKLFKKYLLNVDTLKNVTVSSERRSKIIEICFGSKGSQFDNFLLKGSYLWKAWDYKSLLYSSKTFESRVCSLFDWVFNIRLDGIHQYNPEMGINVKDEGGKGKQAIKAYKNRENMASSCVFYKEDDLIGGIGSGIELVCSMLNTRSMFESFTDNWKLPYLNAYDAKYHNLSLVKECKTLADGLLSKMTSRSVSVTARWIEKADRYSSIEYCLTSFKTGFSEVCRSVVIEDTEEKSFEDYSDIRNLDFSDSGIDESILRLDSYIDRLSCSEVASYFNKKAGFGLDVFETVKRTRRVSYKQQNVLGRLVNDIIEAMGILRSGKAESAVVEGSLSEDKIAMITRAVEIMEDGKLFNSVIKVIPTNALVKMKDVLKSVLFRKIASEKQMYYVNLAQNLVDFVDGKPST